MPKVAAIPCSDRYFSNIHKDVLKAEPDTEEEIAALLEELRTRGNNAFKQQRLQEADALYSKGIDVGPTSDAADTLFSNRSAARLGMGKSDKALDDAISAIRLSPDWPKGYFRKGQALEALSRYDEAVSAFEKVMLLEPDNKAVSRKLVTLKAAAKEAAENPVDKPKESATRVVEQISVAEYEARNADFEKRRTSGKDDVVVDDVVETEKIRGYKTTKDGKKTTFFNHEQTEEEKRLIGDIAPKAISAPICVNDKGVGSAWSNGSTFEEKNKTEWAKSTLERHLLAINVDIPGDGTWGSILKEHTIKVKKVEFKEGEAAIPIVKGKVKFVFDFRIKLSWEAKVEKKKYKGRIVLPDVSSDHDGTFDHEVQYKTPWSKESHMTEFMASFVKSEKKGLKPAMVKAILAFEREFRNQA